MSCVRSAVILIEDGKVALIKRVRDGHSYYLFPGGGVEPRESMRGAAQREAFEELGLMVNVGRLVAQGTFGRREQYYFVAYPLHGTFGAGTGAELRSEPASATGSYCPIWLDMTQLPSYDVRPRSLADALVANVLADEDVVVYISD